MADEPTSRETRRAEPPAHRARDGREPAGEAWYRQAVEESPNPIFVVDVEGRMQAWNRTCERLMADAVHLAGRPCAAFIRLPDGTPPDGLVARVRQGEALAGVELHCSCRDGVERVLLAWVYPITGPDRRAVTGCVFAGADVTDRIRFEEALMAAKDAAEAAVQLKSTILNNLSHEIRTPLTAILGFAELLYEEVPDPYREFLHLIRTSGKRLMGTLVSVLELARLESGDVRFEAEDLDLREEAGEAVRMFTPLAEGKGLHLALGGPEAPLPVRMDRIALNRILSNLLANAIKFTAEGSVRVEVAPAGTAAVVRVVDTGIGIGEAFLPHLFEEFKQESEGLSRRHEGAGLGLAITKRLVEQMGGTITVESARGKGSTFSVYLPRLPGIPS